MNNLQELYQKILNHAKNPVGYGKVLHANCVGALRNPNVATRLRFMPKLTHNGSSNWVSQGRAV